MLAGADSRTARTGARPVPEDPSHTPPNPLHFSICAISGISHPEISPPSDTAGNLTKTPPQQTSFKLLFPSSSQGFAEMSIFPSPLLGCPSNTLHPWVLYSQLGLLELTQGLSLGPLWALSLQSSLRICSPSRGSFWKNSIAWTFLGSTYISGGRPGGGGGDGGRGWHSGGWQVTCRHERSPMRTQPMRESHLGVEPQSRGIVTTQPAQLSGLCAPIFLTCSRINPGPPARGSPAGSYRRSWH